MDKYTVYDGTLRGACGVNHASGFENYNTNYRWHQGRRASAIGGGGADWLTAGFVETPECEGVYDAFVTKHGPPVFQTPVRRNRNSGRKFFFAIWDTKKKRKAKAQ